MGLSTHILDTALGRPAANVALILSQQTATGWTLIGTGATDTDGRCKTLLGDTLLEATTYKIHFDTASYYSAQQFTGLYPFVEIAFTITDPTQHYHVPLLLTANGYTTYRGS